MISPTERDRDDRVSLAGPDPAEVLKALLKVKPDDAERPQANEAAEADIGERDL